MTRSTAGGLSSRVRQRKLNLRTSLQVVKEDQTGTEIFDDVDNQKSVPRVETGVEKAEEVEHHLQAAINASQAAAIGGKVAQIYIPTPDTIKSSVHYDQLYSLTFSQPATYIRFSSTVEDCCGCPYNMVDEDVPFLESLNENQKNASTQCSETRFEEVMYFFEETALTKQPYAVVDSPPVLEFEEMEDAFDDTLDEATMSFAKDIYEHWKARRLKVGNRPLINNLKFETGADTDDADPYVCFRRREVRQIRKTRGRDAQSAEKLRKLRRELEEARELVVLVNQREVTKREQLAVERQIFEQRAAFRQVKRNLPTPYKEGDEDILINQKPQKRKSLEIMTSQRQSAQQLRMPSRPDGRPGEAELILLQDVLAEKDAEIERDINQKIAQHQKWNENFVDMTRAPITPPLETTGRSGFRKAVAEYLPALPTPPASVSSEHSGDSVTDMNLPLRPRDDNVAVRYASPAYDGSCQSQISYRRRYGRGGRLHIDRRGMKGRNTEGIDEVVIDRCKFDDEEDQDEVPVYTVDPYNLDHMRYRAQLSARSQAHPQIDSARRAQVEGGSSSSHATVSSASSSGASRQTGQG